MASEIRVDKINSLSGVGTVTLSPTGVDIAGITTAATLRATTGIVTSLTAGSLTSLGAVSGTTGTFSAAVSGTTGTFSAAVSGTTGTFSGAVSGTTGTFTGDVDIADKIIHTGDTNTAIRFPEADTITFEANGNEQVRINNDVQMFVQANSKQSKLQLHREDVSINADDVVGQITFTGRDSGGAGIQRVGAAISAIASNAWDTGQTTGYSATHLDFYTQAQQSAYSTLTPRARIDSSGRLLIGTTTEGNATGDNLTISDSGNMGMTLRSTDSNYCNIYFSDAESGTAEYEGYVSYNHATNSLEFATGHTEKLRILSSGGITFNGDTATANALDDYEEGTWTPSIYSGGSPSYSQQSGLYTKIGNLVTHIFVMAYSGASASTNTRIQGLPFAYSSTFETSTNMGRIGAAWNDAESAGSRVLHSIGHTGSGTSMIYVDLLTSGTDKTLRGFFQMRV